MAHAEGKPFQDSTETLSADPTTCAVALRRSQALLEEGNSFLQRDWVRAQHEYHQAFVQCQSALQICQTTSDKERARQLQAAIQEAISALLAQVESTLAGDGGCFRPDRWFALHKSAGSLYRTESNFWFPKDKSSPEKSLRALHHLHRALEIAPNDEREVSRVREQICKIHHARFLDLGYRQDAEGAESGLRWLLRRSPNSHEYLSRLSLCLGESFIYTHSRSVLEEALELGQEAFVEACDSEDEDIIVNGTQAVVHALRERSKADGSLDDVEIAIALLRCSLNRLSQHSSNRYFLELDLGEALRMQFSATEREEDLDEALALAAACKDKQDNLLLSLHGRMLLGLLQSDRLRFEYNSNPAAFNEARQNLFQVSGWFSDEAPHLVAYQCRLGLARLLRYGWEQIEQPDEGAQVYASWAFFNGYRAYAQARKLSKSWRHDVIIWNAAYELSRMHCYRNIGSYLVSDAQAAVRMAGRAVKSLIRPTSLFTKPATALLSAEKSLQRVKSQEVMAQSESHPASISLAGRVALAHQVCHLARTTGEEDEAHVVVRLRNVVQMNTRHRQVRFDIVGCYGRALADRAYTSRTAENFSEAISFCSDGQRALLNGGFSYTLLLHLAWLFFWRFVQFGQLSDAEQAWSKLSDILSPAYRWAYTPFDRLDALEKLFDLQKDFRKDFSSVEKTLDQAMQVAQDLFGPVRQIQDQLGLIRRFGSVSERIAAQALTAGMPLDRVFAYMQQIHTIQWNQVTKSTDLATEDIDSQLKEEEAAFRNVTIGPKPRRIAGEIRDEFIHAEKHYRVFKKIQAAATVNGLDRALYLRGRLRAYLGPVPLVAILESSYLKHGKALIFRNGGFESIELEAVCPPVTKLMHEAWMHARSAGHEGLGHPGIRILLDVVLQILWYYIAKPILDHLGFIGSAQISGDLPQVYWLASGIISVIPIHVAGVYGAIDTALMNALLPASTVESVMSKDGVVGQAAERQESAENSSVHDRVVSSYIPSVRALQYVQERKQKKSSTPTDNDSALVVAMEHTRGLTHLDHAKAEADTVVEICKQRYTVKQPLAFASSIESALRECSVAHFITHGKLSPDDPLASQICLRDYLSKKDSMTVGHIMNLQLDKCRLVFLNICDAALTADFAYRNQGLHLPGAFHMAGVPTVIGTWYPVVDLYGAQVAGDFYRNCWAPDKAVFDFDRAAIALHEAVRGLRRQGCHHVEWGVYSHFGI